MNTRGFTLIELAIVLVIVGILAAIAVPRFADMTNEARLAQRQSTLASLRSAYAIYIAKNAGNAPTWTQLQTWLDVPTTQLKLGTGGAIYMDYDNNNTVAATGERVSLLFSDEACTTVVANATTAIRCIRNGIN